MQSTTALKGGCLRGAVRLLSACSPELARDSDKPGKNSASVDQKRYHTVRQLFAEMRITIFHILCY
jgi:hypothetical protein